jgi:hypothetical protein
MSQSRTRFGTVFGNAEGQSYQGLLRDSVDTAPPYRKFACCPPAGAVGLETEKLIGGYKGSALILSQVSI